MSSDILYCRVSIYIKFSSKAYFTDFSQQKFTSTYTELQMVFCFRQILLVDMEKKWRQYGGKI
jgi:hypothetical protein